MTTGVVSTQRMQQGIQTHIKRQEEQKKISEFPLEYMIEGVNVKIRIRGKADIVDTSGEIAAIEEIKTYFGKIEKKKSVSDEHLAQCKCYCAMYVIKNNIDEITARIAYVEYESSETKFFEYNYTKDEILNWFDEKLEYILNIFESRQEHINKRDLSAREMKFPFGKYRAGQKEMATYVYKGCKNSTIQFIQAPTGIGKTMGTIYPAVKAFAYEGYERIFYATAKNTIKKIAEEAINVLRNKGLIINSIALTAKETSCPQKIYNCHPKVCSRARGYYDRLGLAMDCFEENKHYNIEEVRKIADKFNICPFELSLDISVESDIIICDYNNIYDPRAKLKRFFDDGGDYAALIDEAHNLVGRAREMYSGEIDKKMYDNLAAKMSRVRSKGAIAALEHAESISQYLNQQIKDMDEADINHEILEQPLDVLNKRLEKFIEAAEAVMDMSSTREYTKDFLDVFYNTKGYLLTLAKADENYIHYIVREDGNIRIKMFCIDPSQRLQDCHNKSRATVLFSASLTPFKYYTRLLQKSQDCATYELASPFYKDNLKVIINANLPVEYKFRDKFIKELAESIYTFVKAKKGKYLIFFPSYGYMDKVHKLFIALYDDIFAPKQQRNMDSRNREAFISLFSDDAHMAAFAVMGGVFSEGIDLKGEKLIGAVIVGTGFPMISLENNFIRDFHDSKEEEGLGYAYIYPGFNKVLQSVGRVIRSEEDKGAVLLIDRRFARQEYQNLMPSWWKPLEYADDIDDIKKSIVSFWE
ncbi:MAG: ATP-dependent DNA helicase [Eubacteriales bacterium]